MSSRALQFLARLWPLRTRGASLVALTGAASESVLLLTLHPGSYFARPRRLWIAALLLLGLWVLALGALGALRRGLESLLRSRGRLTRALAFAPLIALGLLPALVYLGSWGLYLRTGRFLDADSARFAWENLQTAWFRTYLLESEGRLVWGAGAALALGTLALLRLALRRPPQRVSGAPLGTWLGFLILLSALVVGPALRELLPERRVRALDALACALHPAFTLLSTWDLGAAEPEAATVLDERTLVRRDSVTWQPGPPSTGSARGPGRPNVLLLAIESLRADVVGLRVEGQEVMPTLGALARGGRVLTRAYSNSTHSDYADPCPVTSLYPLRSARHHYHRAGEPWPCSRIYDLLGEAGYVSAIISSQNEAWGGMEHLLASPHLALYYHPERSDAPTRVSERDTGFADALGRGELRAGSLDDAHTAEVAADWMRARLQGAAPFFLWMNFQSSHFPYEIAAEAPRPFQPCAIDFDASFLDYPADKAPVLRNAYWNSLRYADTQLARMLEALREADALSTTLVVVYGENGEAFHENGSVTHAREPVEPAVRVALVLSGPGQAGAGSDDYPVELVDLAPTLLGQLGLPPHPGHQGLDVLAPGRPPAAERALFLHVETGLARADAVLVGGRWKFVSDRARGQEHLYDVPSDPGEARDLLVEQHLRAAGLRSLLLAWRTQQLAYYRQPRYYETYLPPRPPRPPHAPPDAR